ncbi:MAG: hypothetical protein VR70_12315 [Rhodospirillaceae bacterium BRH_c57]|nr:MAG: hypothetical protein VR70_12315 [Rhodospirillaceae bacterium BRH_c57]
MKLLILTLATGIVMVAGAVQARGVEIGEGQVADAPGLLHPQHQQLASGDIGASFDADTGSSLQPTPVKADLDVRGVRIGMTPDEVRALLTEKFPTARINEATTKPDFLAEEYVSGMFMVLQNMDRTDSLRVAFAPPEGGNRVMEVFRHFERTSASAREMAAITVAEEFLKKYGPPSFQEDSKYNLEMNWSFDQYGAWRQVEDWRERKTARACAVSKSYHGGCPTVSLQVRVDREIDSGQLEEFEVMLRDTRYALESLNAAHKSR